MHISIIGCGYVGLVTGTCLAEIGHEIVCSDNDGSKIQILREGGLPIYEPGLEELVRQNVAEHRLTFTADLGEAVRFGEVVFLCVGTPPMQNGDADLSAVDMAARLIVTEARSRKIVVEKSTVPTQTGQKLKRALGIYARNTGSRNTFLVASNPEFLREGTAVLDFLHPDRIVVGVEDDISEQYLREIYSPIVERTFACPIHEGFCPQPDRPALLVTGINSAELIKHACNTFLALKISYVNLIADVCENVGADVEQVVQAMGLDPRIGPAFLKPGLGFGGFCLPKDIQAFVKVGERAGVDVSLLRAAESINKGRIEQFVHKIHQALWVLKGKRVGVLGLAFKPQTDDIRCSPALQLISRLLDYDVHLQAYDPQAMAKAQAEMPSIRYCESAYDAARDADALVIATEWEEFGDLNWMRVRDLMARPLIFDGRDLLDSETMAEIGFEYHGIGKPAQELGQHLYDAKSAHRQ